MGGTVSLSHRLQKAAAGVECVVRGGWRMADSRNRIADGKKTTKQIAGKRETLINLKKVSTLLCPHIAEMIIVVIVNQTKTRRQND